MAASIAPPPPWAARTMEDLRAPAATWGQELRSYEHEKRRVVDEGLVRGQQLQLPKGAVQMQERVFDPLLQRFRDPGVESRQRHLEERERVAHLNRAQDIDIIRSQPFNIVNNSSRLEALAPGQDPMRLGGQPGHGTLGERARRKEGSTSAPSTCVDYNIVSNLPFDVHHWQPPGERPRAKEREGVGRKVPHWSVKDFDIVTNRYNDRHEEKMAKQKHLNLLEATHKHSQVNKFDPLTQQFVDPRHEERARAALDAREVEANMRADSLVPPSYKGRLSAHYGILSHEVHNPDMVRLHETLENERKDRYGNRYIVEHNFHVQDVKHDHIVNSRRLNRIAPERFEEPKRRGFDIIDNRTHGRLPTEKQLHEDMTSKRPSPWERAQQGRLSTSSGNPEDLVATIRMPEAEQGRRSLASSSSAPQLRGGSGRLGGAASGRAAAAPAPRASAPASQRSRSLAASTPSMPPGGGFAPPPPPMALPGGPAGAVYSQPRGY